MEPLTAEIEGLWRNFPRKMSDAETARIWATLDAARAELATERDRRMETVAMCEQLKAELAETTPWANETIDVLEMISKLPETDADAATQIGVAASMASACVERARER